MEVSDCVPFRAEKGKSFGCVTKHITVLDPYGRVVRGDESFACEDLQQRRFSRCGQAQPEGNQRIFLVGSLGLLTSVCSDENCA
jgi:hypothetical protein